MVPVLFNWVTQGCCQEPKWISSFCSAILRWYCFLPSPSRPYNRFCIFGVECSKGILQRRILSPASFFLCLYLSYDKGRITLFKVLWQNWVALGRVVSHSYPKRTTWKKNDARHNLPLMLGREITFHEHVGGYNSNNIKFCWERNKEKELWFKPQ